MKEASAEIGRSPSYLHQYLERGTPKALGHADAESLAKMLGCKASELRHAQAPRRRPQKRRRRTAPPPGAPLVAIPEMAVEAAAGPGALNEEFAAEKARWYLPEGMIRHEGDADPGSLRVLRARGDSMEPLISDGDRLLVDLARRTPGHRRDGRPVGRLRAGGQARRGAAASRAAQPPPPLRPTPNTSPIPASPRRPHIVGRVVWTVRKC